MEKIQNFDARAISQSDFAALAVENLAYVKRVEDATGVGHAIHAADGTELAIMGEREIAFAAIRQNGLEPVSVH